MAVGNAMLSTAKPRGNMVVQLDDLDKALGALREDVDGLVNSLEPVSIPAGPMTQDGGVEKATEVSHVSARIRSFVHQVQDMRRLVQDQRERLDV